MRRLVLALLLGVAAAAAAPGAAPAAAPAASAASAPIYAYYYIWFNPSSWNRAKIDYPQLGRYSSDEQTVMREHVRLAKRAGITGFIVSWKSAPHLDERLAKLIRVAERERFKLVIIYQGLDFERRPLSIGKVAADFDLFASSFGKSKVFRGFGKPVIVWSGTWRFTIEEIARVTDAHRDALTILATERNPDDYLAKMSLFDGNAYYWGSVNPDTYPAYEEKLRKMGSVVHENGGLWIAPAAPGFDARLVGGRGVVDRKGGATLRRQLDAAQQSNPDAIGLISWNEFSENTHVEPSERHGGTALEVLADFQGARFEYRGELDTSAPAGRAEGLGSITKLAAFLAILLMVVISIKWRRDGQRRRRRPGGGSSGGRNPAEPKELVRR